MSVKHRVKRGQRDSLFSRLKRLKQKRVTAWSAAALAAVALVVTLIWAQHHFRAPDKGDGTASKASEKKLVSLAVKVVGIDGKPVPNAKTRLLVEKKTFVQQSDAAGISRYVDLHPGEGRLVVEAVGMARKTVRVSFQKVENSTRVSLVKGESLQGSVVDDLSAAIPKARVTLRLQEEEDSEPWSAKTDEKGLFSVSTLVAGTYTVDVEAEMHERSVHRKVGVPANKPIKIILRRVASLSGQVIRTDGKPAEGATVLIAGSGIWPARKVKAGERGRFEIIGLPSGVYEVRASLKNAISKPKQGLEIEPGSRNSLTLRLIPGVSLKGKVFDAVSEKPLGNADVTVGEDSLCFIPIAVRTDDQGEFVVSGLLDKPHRVSIRSLGYVPVTNQIRSAGREKHAFPMRRAAVVAGKVVDNQGAPIPQAMIELLGTSKTGEPITMRSDALSFRSTLFESQLRGPLPLTNSKGHLSSENLGVTPGVVPMIPSQLKQQSKASRKKDTTASGFVTDKQGRFRIQGVPPGTVQVIARHRDYALKIGKEFSVASGSVTDNVTIVLSEGGVIEGQVVDDKGTPVGLVRLEMKVQGDLFPRTTLSSEDGSFRFANVLGAVVITALPIGRPAARAELQVEPKKRHRVELKVLTGSSTLEGRVLDHRGFPISGAIVRVQSANARSPFDITALSESDGSFAVLGLPSPPYRVSASHHDYAENSPVEVSSSHRRVVINLETGVAVKGIVIDDWHQKPLGGATIELQSASGTKRVKTRTTNKGTFQFRSITSGKYYIIVTKKNYVTDRIELDLLNQGRRENTVEIETVYLTPGGSVSGEVVDSRGAVVQAAEVAIGSPPIWKNAVRTDAKGHFLIDGIPSGSVTLSARHKKAGEAELLRAVRVFPLQETPGVLIRLPGR